MSTDGQVAVAGSHDQLAGAALLDLADEDLVVLRRARRVAERVVRTSEVERELVAGPLADLAVDRLPHDDRVGVPTGGVLLHPRAEPLAARDGLRIVVGARDAGGAEERDRDRDRAGDLRTGPG